MYMKVIYISDLVKNDGYSLKTQVYSKPSPSDSKYEWPSILKPNIKQWKVWRKLMEQICTTEHQLKKEYKVTAWFNQYRHIRNKYNYNSHI